jgi:hypothetical protein
MKKQATSTPATLPKPQDTKVTPKKPVVDKPEDDEETEDQLSGTQQPEKPNPFNAKRRSDDDDSDDTLPDVPVDNRKRFSR